MLGQKILVVDDEKRMRKLVKAGDPGRNDAKDGRVAGLPGDPSVFQGADHHAHGEGL